MNTFEHFMADSREHWTNHFVCAQCKGCNTWPSYNGKNPSLWISLSLIVRGRHNGLSINVDYIVLLSRWENKKLPKVYSVTIRGKSFNYLTTNVCRTRSARLEIVPERLNRLPLHVFVSLLLITQFEFNFILKSIVLKCVIYNTQWYF